MSVGLEAFDYWKHEDHIRDTFKRLVKDRVQKMEFIAKHQARLEEVGDRAQKRFNRLLSEGYLEDVEKRNFKQLEAALGKVKDSRKARARNMSRVNEDTKKPIDVLEDAAKAIDEVAYSNYEDEIRMLEGLLPKDSHNNASSKEHAKPRMGSRGGSTEDLNRDRNCS